ncbi:MAG: ABC transporter ATP-binding protein [Desulfatiglans sp.]|nr:ABC transporter ATP-binding protein [Thermodesulfobacteriota bacterium]MEE4352854.1 ABC transporter ATP-binding protein [Desulfatiglans sp.]
MFLEVRDLTVLYDRAMVLNKVSLQVDHGEMVSLVGPNGAGKSTLLRAMVGLVKWEKDTLKGTVAGRITCKGTVKFDGEEMATYPAHKVVEKGLILCPERGRPFREMTVQENLDAGAYLVRDKKIIGETKEKVFQLFPILKRRVDQISGTLSGGERTMLSIGRSLMAQARLLLIDEPSVGLAPKVKKDLFARIRDVHDLGITILLVEQDVSFAFDLSSRNYVLSRGKIIAEGTAKELLGDELIRKTYLGL